MSGKSAALVHHPEISSTPAAAHRHNKRDRQLDDRAF
jgi:hypothetical protein